MKVRDIIKQLQDEGWYLARQSGSHKIFKHNHKPAIRIVLPDHGNNKEPSIGVMILRRKQAGNNKILLRYAISSNF
jgi:predicted RNA binding protein YcfA (HicA-like mRNA interferase family)